jgi:hypothetical protein
MGVCATLIGTVVFGSVRAVGTLRAMFVLLRSPGRACGPREKSSDLKKNSGRNHQVNDSQSREPFLVFRAISAAPALAPASVAFLAARGCSRSVMLLSAPLHMITTHTHPAPSQREAGTSDRSALYESLYANHGYHADINITHAAELIEYLILPQFADASARRHVRVLDVGCSHGRGVQLLWHHGFSASGMDLAATAVAMATKHRAPTMGAEESLTPCGGDACFKQGSAASIPWANESFDAIMTTDVLEHVPPPLIGAVVSEFARVATRQLF